MRRPADARPAHALRAPSVAGPRLGVLPLMLASGAGAEMRQVLGTVVFGGMLGVTLIGLLLTPVFYTVIRGRLREAPVPDAPAGESQP